MTNATLNAIIKETEQEKVVCRKKQIEEFTVQVKQDLEDFEVELQAFIAAKQVRRFFSYEVPHYKFIPTGKGEITKRDRCQVVKDYLPEYIFYLSCMKLFHFLEQVVCLHLL